MGGGGEICEYRRGWDGVDHLCTVVQCHTKRKELP